MFCFLCEFHVYVSSCRAINARNCGNENVTASFLQKARTGSGINVSSRERGRERVRRGEGERGREREREKASKLGKMNNARRRM
jgi:hypothetical protein